MSLIDLYIASTSVSVVIVTGSSSFVSAVAWIVRPLIENVLVLLVNSAPLSSIFASTPTIRTAPVVPAVDEPEAVVPEAAPVVADVEAAASAYATYALAALILLSSSVLAFALESVFVLLTSSTTLVLDASATASLVSLFNVT